MRRTRNALHGFRNANVRFPSHWQDSMATFADRMCGLPQECPAFQLYDWSKWGYD